jgi:hypothetical protein
LSLLGESMREILQRSKDGVLSGDDVADYALELNRLIGDFSGRERLGRNARASAHEFEREPSAPAQRSLVHPDRWVAISTSFGDS